jgi:hypothetical protein
MGALLDLAIKAASQPKCACQTATPFSRDVEQRLGRAIAILSEVPTRRAAYVAGQESAGLVPGDRRHPYEPRAHHRRTGNSGGSLGPVAVSAIPGRAKRRIGMKRVEEPRHPRSNRDCAENG